MSAIDLRFDMGKIFMIMGKSASGKDMIYRKLISDKELGLKPVVSYTTRPMRVGEQDGREYYFADLKRLEQLRMQGRIVEERVYHTVHGDRYYFTADEGQIRPEEEFYLTIGTLQSFMKMKGYFEGYVSPIYIEVDDYLRLTRAIEREKMQEKPAYKEVCRRYVADEEDFSEENLAKAEIKESFLNNEGPEKCFSEIRNYIYREMRKNG